MMDANAVFADRFLNSKSLYLYRFNNLPSLHFIANIEGEKAYNAFKEAFVDMIVTEYQYRWYKKRKKSTSLMKHFSSSIIIVLWS